MAEHSKEIVHDYEVWGQVEGNFYDRSIDALLSPCLRDYQSDLRAYKRMTERVERLTLEAQHLRTEVISDLRKEFSDIETDVDKRQKETEEVRQTARDVSEEMEVVAYVEGMIKRLEQYGKSLRLVAYHVDDIYEKVFQADENSFSHQISQSTSVNPPSVKSVLKKFLTPKKEPTPGQSKSDSQLLNTIDEVDHDPPPEDSFNMDPLGTATRPRSAMSSDTGDKWLTSSPIERPIPDFVSPRRTPKSSQEVWMERYHGYYDDD